MSAAGWLRSATTPADDPTERIIGTSGEGRVLVVTATDEDGDPTEYTWMSPAVADHYDVRVWWQ